MMSKDLTMLYRVLDRDLADLYYRINTEKTHEFELFIPTDENIKAVRAELLTLKDRIAQIDAPDAVYVVMKHHFEDFADTIGFNIDGAEADPSGILLAPAYQFENTCRLSRQTAEKKVDYIKNKFCAVFDNVDIVKELMYARLSADSLAGFGGALQHCKGILNYELGLMGESWADASEAQREEVKGYVLKAIGLYDSIASELPVSAEKAVEDDITKKCQMPDGAYKDTLHRLYGVELDDMESWYLEEIEKTRDEVFEIAHALPIDDPKAQTMEECNDILFKYSAPCKTADEMYVRAAEYMKRSRAVAHEMLRLPEDEQCLAVRLPYSCKDTFPWGGCEGGDFTVQPLIGQMFLNQYNYKNITDAWIKMNTMHESYPGHHCQGVRAAIDPLPETMKIGTKSVPLTEGTCLRTERAFEDTFAEDPFYKLHIAYRRHHTAVRILVDFTLFYKNGTIEDACNIYKKEMGLDFVTARGQVRSHQATPGYFTTYHYGMKKLTQWEKDYGFSKKDYTELLFSAGHVSMDTFKMYLDLSEADRQRYYNEFKSLYMD